MLLSLCYMIQTMICDATFDIFVDSKHNAVVA